MQNKAEPGEIIGKSLQIGNITIDLPRVYMYTAISINVVGSIKDKTAR